MPIENLNSTSTLAEIADSVANEYYRRDFPLKPKADEPVDLHSYLIHGGRDGYIPRPYFGFQTAARAATLVPAIFSLYQKHAPVITGRLQREVTEYQLLSSNQQAEMILVIQVAALMQHAGRCLTPSDKPDETDFIKQSQLEFTRLCVKISHSRHARRSSEVAMELSLIEDKSGFGLEAALLSDVMKIETLRLMIDDQDAIDRINLTTLAIFKNSTQPADLRDDLLWVLKRHFNVIKKQHLKPEYEFSTPYSRFALETNIAQYFPFMHELDTVIRKASDPAKKTALQHLHQKICVEIDQNRCNKLSDIVASWKTPEIEAIITKHRHRKVDSLFKKRHTDTRQYIEKFVKKYGDINLGLNNENNNNRPAH